MGWVWVLIPLAAIIIGGITEIIKESNKRATRLGETSDELSNALSTLRSQMDRMEEGQKAGQKRLQNLEAIVTNQVWDILHDETQTKDERLASVDGSGLLASAEGFDAPDNAKEVEKLARRLRG